MPIFDQGYQHWSGALSGHAWRWLSITRHGIRAGLKKPAIRILLMIAWLPALGLAFMLCVWGLMEQKSDMVAPLVQFLGFFQPQMIADPRHYRVEVWTLSYSYFLLTELRFSMILVLLVGPSLISQDLRFNALPLYFSRPLRRIDYFIGKLGVIAAFLAMVVVVPSVIAYALGLLFSLDLSIVRDTYPLLLASIAYGVVIALSTGLLMLALSSLSRNSRHVVLFWLGIWFVSGIVGGALQDIERNQQARAFYTSRQAMDRPPPELSADIPEDPEGRREAMDARQRAFRTMQQRNQNAWNDLQAEELRASKTDWRPLVSYTENLSRVGRKLLGTDASWETLGQLQPAEQRDGFLLRNMGPQYPWYWSAAVLAALCGLSACILHYRVRSLDRLK